MEKTKLRKMNKKFKRKRNFQIVLTINENCGGINRGFPETEGDQKELEEVLFEDALEVRQKLLEVFDPDVVLIGDVTYES
jgi:hypothetical protein